MNTRACMLVLLFAVLTNYADAQECGSVVNRKSVSIDYGSGNALLIERSEQGMLRGVDAVTGSELWQFVPPEVLTSQAHTGLMTDLAILRFDANGDDIIDRSSGDRVWVYFGLKRAGAYYYAIDVSDRTPRVLWRQDTETLPGLSDAWSAPALTRVRIAGTVQNGEHFVLIVGGGLDGAQLLMLDAATGRRLWSAGSESSHDRVLSQMTQGIAARVTAVDFDGDEYADRFYASDVGGRIWRFDVWNGRSRADVVTGGIFAALSGPDSANARRFFNAPDVTLMHSRDGKTFLNIAIGSGDAVNPGAVSVQDRFYSLRDNEPFVKRTQAAYDSAPPIKDADLTGSSSGWKLELDANGEKVLTDSLTVQGVVMFTTHSGDCDEGGANRIHYVWLDDGKAVLDLNDNGKVTDEDRSLPLTQTGIADGPRIELLPPLGPRQPGVPPSEPADPGEAGQAAGTRCLVGTEVLAHCVPIGTVLRTYWKRTSIN